MKESFYASLCANGLHGGAVYLLDDGFCFRCQKATIEDIYKNLWIPYDKIQSVRAGKRMLFIPTTVITTRDGWTCRFLIFNRKRFMKCYSERSCLQECKDMP